MTSTDTTTAAAESQRDTLTLDFELAHAPEKVWRALVDPELLARLP